MRSARIMSCVCTTRKNPGLPSASIRALTPVSVLHASKCLIGPACLIGTHCAASCERVLSHCSTVKNPCGMEPTLSIAPEHRQRIRQRLPRKWAVNFTLVWYSPSAVTAPGKMPPVDRPFRMTKPPSRRSPEPWVRKVMEPYGYEGHTRRFACWRCGGTAVSTHARPGQAGSAVWRPLPHHRYHALQLHQLRPAPYLCPHPVQGAQPEPPHPRGMVGNCSPGAGRV